MLHIWSCVAICWVSWRSGARGQGPSLVGHEFDSAGLRIVRGLACNLYLTPPSALMVSHEIAIRKCDFWMRIAKASRTIGYGTEDIARDRWDESGRRS
jgi:hypothetical protein